MVLLCPCRKRESFEECTGFLCHTEHYQSGTHSYTPSLVNNFWARKPEMDFPPPAWPLHTLSSVESSYWTSVKSASSPPPISKKHQKAKNKTLRSPWPTWKVSETFDLVFCSESYLHLQYSFHVTLSEVSNNQSNPEKEQSWRHHTYWLQTILQSYINPTVQYWHGNSHIDQWNRMESPEIDPQTYGSVNIWQGSQ